MSDDGFPTFNVPMKIKVDGIRYTGLQQSACTFLVYDGEKKQFLCSLTTNPGHLDTCLFFQKYTILSCYTEGIAKRDLAVNNFETELRAYRFAKTGFDESQFL